MQNWEREDLKSAIENAYLGGKITLYEKFDLLLKIDQSQKLEEIIRIIKK